ncbi:MAG: glycosyltransferase family 39 protein [Ruminococcus sp.]|nr:glycosyltransferase family 39 protein [Ruminococcus sp.]
MQLKNTKSKTIIFSVIISMLTIILFVTLFNNLGANAIADWDEARHGINAYEMLKNNNWIVSTYMYETDLWNLKPPFSYYLIALSFQLFGFNTFALRLYSVFSIIILYIVISYVLYKVSGKVTVCVFAILFLSFGDFFFGHCGRTGDADALFLLLSAISMLSLSFCNKHHWALYIFGLSASTAFLSKSFHAAPILLIGLCFLLFSKTYKNIKIVEYLITLATIILPIAIWALFRYFADGMAFLGSMFGVDVTQRMNNGVSQGGSYFTFIKYLLSYRSTQCILCIIVVCYIFTAILKKSFSFELNPIHKTMLLSIIINLIFFSLTRTVETWYYYPTFLYLIVFASGMVTKTFNTIKENNIRKGVMALTCIIGSALLIFTSYQIYTNLRQTFSIRKTNAQDTIIEFCQKYPKYKGYNCYFIKSKSEDPYPLDIKEGVWEQCDVLCAELSGDYKCVNGGIKAYSKDTKAIIFIENNITPKYKSNLSHDVKYELKDYHVYTHRQP